MGCQYSMSHEPMTQWFDRGNSGCPRLVDLNHSCRHRRWLLEMTVGGEISPLLSLLVPSLLPYFLLPSSFVTIPVPPHPSVSLLSPPVFPLPLNSARGLGECYAVSSPAAAKRFWYIFRLKSSHLLSMHNDIFIFVIFTVHFAIFACFWLILLF